jgi:hypothetical protein
MFSISGITPSGLSGKIFARTSQDMGASADRGPMDPIKGTDASLAVAQIAIKAQGDAENLEMARMGLVLDTMKNSGAQLVKLLENLGQNIDLYA